MFLKNEILSNEFSKCQFDKAIKNSNPHFSKKDITLEVLYYCRNVMANVVKEQGEDYLSIFIYIQKKINELEEVEKHRRIALQLVDDVIK